MRKKAKTITILNNKVIKSKAKPFDEVIIKKLKKYDLRNQKQVTETNKVESIRNITIKSGVANNLIHKYSNERFSTDLSKLNHSLNRISYQISLIKDIEVFSFNKIKYILASGKATIEVKYDNNGLTYSLNGNLRIHNNGN